MALSAKQAVLWADKVPAASDQYVRELDGLRAVAVGFVVFAHYGIIPYMPGGFGVTLFFFLSGYLITTLFYAEYRSNSNINIPQFYLRRWLRLTPSLIAFVLLATTFYHVSRTAVDGQPVPAGTILAALFYYTNYYDLAWGLDPARVIPFGICWSLAVEEHFYLGWPLILRKAIQNPARLCLLVAALCASVLAWRVIARFGLRLGTDYTYMATDSRIDSILYGAGLRALFESPWAAAAMRLLRSPVCRIVALLSLLATFVIRDDNFRETVRYTIQGIALMPIFTAILSDDPATVVRRILSSSAMVLIGRLSYSIYLFHLVARTPGEVYFGSPHHIGSIVSGLVLTGAVSYGLLIFVERPVGKLRHRFRAGQGAARLSPAVDPGTASAMLAHRAERPG
jgi:peptidoglycan/LPS O-acetylase OafA/YrhL